MAHPRAALALAVGCLFAFAGLTALVAVGHVGGLDLPVRAWMHSHQQAALHAAARIITDVLSPVVDAAVLLVVAGLTARRNHRLAPVTVGLVVLAVTSTVVITVKHAVGRPAPYPGAGSGLSFPSGHTVSTLALLGAAALIGVRSGRRRRASLAVVAGLTFGCAVSLVYAGYHWLSDTLASAVLGVALLIGVELWLSRRTASRPPPASPTRWRRS